jgi:hypothetical protein
MELGDNPVSTPFLTPIDTIMFDRGAEVKKLRGCFVL